MKHVQAMLFGLVIVLSCAPSVIGAQGDMVPPVADMASVFVAIDRAAERVARGDAGLSGELARHAETLTEFLRKGDLTGPQRFVATYYRGLARFEINASQFDKGEAIDTSAARQALADFDYVIDNAGRIGAKPEFVGNVEYRAGSIAFNFLNEIPLGYTYWNKCAELDHAGCLNIMADARLAGAGGQPQDIPQALDLHTRIFNTGTRYTCAGAYSALSIANIVYFTGVRRPGDDEIEWMARSNDLLDQLQAKGRKDPCQRGQFEIAEFLLRLSRGDREETILRKALDRADDPASQSVAQYFLGTIDAAAFRIAVKSVGREYDRCRAYFAALWYAALANDQTLARAYYDLMKEIKPDKCESEPIYAKKFGF